MSALWIQLRLRDTGLGMRLGLTCLILTLFGGYTIASLLHLNEHHQNRDGRTGLSVTDIEGAYRGATNESLLLVALNRGHPPDLPEDEKEILLNWLGGEPHEIRANFDNFDFAEIPVSDIFLDRCSDCHAGNAERGAGIRLEFWDDIQKVAFSNEIQPTDTKILLASTHAHASTMAVISIVIALLAYLTRAWRFLVNLLIFIGGAALLLDIGSWWLARASWIDILGEDNWLYSMIDEGALFGHLIRACGAAHSGAIALLMLLIVLDLWLPRRRDDVRPRADKLAKAVVYDDRKQREGKSGPA